MDTEYKADSSLLDLKERLDEAEKDRLSPLAMFSSNGVRRRFEDLVGHRQAFALDADRILHTRAYTRYIDKTQVFYMVDNDHITHRVLHVQLVSKIARTIGRFLGLNEDLIEAIALGHDIGHPPFGHDGEKELTAICRDHGLPPFQHNIQGVRFLESIERRGRGCNLTLQTLDGILCHDGEVHARGIIPRRDKDFAEFDREMNLKAADPAVPLVPATLEGCVVRFSDTIAYIGRDIEDAIELKMISRSEIPAECREILGDTNGTIVYRLVEDLINSSITAAGDRISFSPAIADSLEKLKMFNYERIYLNPELKKGFAEIKKSYRILFETYLEHIDNDRRDSVIFREFLDDMEPVYLDNNEPAVMVRDFIAGMTDDYFISRSALIGCEVPVKS